MLLDPLEQAGALEFRDHLPPSLVAIEALKAVRSGQADPGLGRHDIDGRQLVPAADLEVERIMRRGHLHGTRPELGVDGIVGHHRDPAVYQRKQHLSSDQRAISLIVGMHRHGGVAEHRFRPSGGDGHVATVR